MREARFKLDLNRIFREQTIKEKYKVGYRSTVAYTIRFTPFPSPQEAENGDTPTEADIKECKASFYTFLAEAKVKFSGALSDRGMTVDEGNMALNFLAHEVKWYETYEDVMMHEGLMELGQAWEDMGNKNIGGIFIRIGEEMDDIIQEGWGEHDWDWMCVDRQVICDWTE
jgi:hypothetical protein